MIAYPPKERDSIPMLFDHAINQRWRKMRRVLSKDKWRQQVPVRDSAGNPLLHICIAFDAPLDIVQRIHSIDSTQILEKGDGFDGMTPLHIACRRYQYESVKTSPDVVQFLLDHGCDVREADKYERVALHHALDCICCDKDMWIEDGVDLIDLLCESDPTMVFAEDHNGMTPIDIVQNARLFPNDDIENERLEMLYKALQKVSVNLYLRNKCTWEQGEGIGAEDNRKVIKECISKARTKRTSESSSSSSSTSLPCAIAYQLREDEAVYNPKFKRQKSPLMKRITTFLTRI